MVMIDDSFHFYYFSCLTSVDSSLFSIMFMSKDKKKKKNASRNRERLLSYENDACNTAIDDDGTQVEEKEKELKKRRKTSGTRRTRHQPPQTNPGKEAYQFFVKHTCSTGIQGLLDEFNDIKKQTQAIGATPKIAFDSNPTKNRYKDVYCVDESRVVLQDPNGLNTYIHANFVPVDDKHKYICTQGPIPTTIDDFWRMVWQEQCKSILMLCNIVEQGKKKCEQYWPESGEMQYGTVSVKVVKKVDWLKFMTRTNLLLTVGTDTLEVEHIQWNDWPDRGVPLDVQACVHLITLLGKLSPTVIHCSAGIGRTGTIVGLDMMLTKLKSGVKTTLKDVVMELRAKRHGSVQMDIQYLYMHRVLLTDAVKNNAATKSEIANFINQYEALCKQRGFM